MKGLQMKIYNLELTFPGQYIGHPYWVEMFELIQITKLSGMNRAKSEANRRKALDGHLRAIGMTLDQYTKLEELSKRPFHVNADGQIIIPADNFLSFLVAATDEARSAQRACQKEQVRSRFTATDFVTNKTGPDGMWKRFSTVNAGAGAKLSNQRGLRENHYIENFTAAGQISFDEQFVKPDVLKNLIDFGGDFVGIGASRKMGKGRFKLTGFELVK
jgi:hypothetical protein